MSDNKRTAVFGIYAGRPQAEDAVDALIETGFSAGHISVLLAEGGGTTEFAHQKHTKAPEGTAVGAAAGGVLLSVHCDTSEEIDLAKDVLKRTGAEDIASAGEAKADSHEPKPSDPYRSVRM